MLEQGVDHPADDPGVLLGWILVQDRDVLADELAALVAEHVVFGGVRVGDHAGSVRDVHAFGHALQDARLEHELVRGALLVGDVADLHYCPYRASVFDDRARRERHREEAAVPTDQHLLTAFLCILR